VLRLSEASQVNEKLVKEVQQLLKLPEEDREKLIDICRKYPPQKIIRAAMAAAIISTKNMKPRRRLSVEEFEKIVRKTRF